MNESKTVVLFFGDEEYGLFESRHLFGDYFLTIIDDEAIIATLTPSLLLPGAYEIDREILAFQACDEINEILTYAEKMSAAEFIELVAKFGLN